MFDDGKPVEYSVEWTGPVRGRSCTDWSWFAIFLAFMGCWAGVGYYSISHGETPEGLSFVSEPVDSYGRRCGVDSAVKNAPYLVYFDLTQCLGYDGKCHTPQVCREECPTTNWYYDLGWDFQSVEKLRRDMICETGFDLSAKGKPKLKELILRNRCTKWYLKSTSFERRCIPQKVPREFVNVTLSEQQLKYAQEVIKKESLKEGIRGTNGFFDTAIATGPTVAIMIAGSAGICLTYLFLMRWFAFEFAISSTAVMVGFLGGLSYYFADLYAKTDDTSALVQAIIFGVIAAFIVLLVLCLLSKIRRACEFLKEASAAVMTMISTLIFPILPAAVRLTAVVYFIVTAAYLLSIKAPESWLFGLLVVAHIVGFVWFYCFVTALSEMILASAFVTWYWTPNKSNVPFFTLLAGAGRTFRYHLGTVAFGSLLLTICRVLRIVLEILMYAARENGVWCLYCLLYYIRSIVKLFEKLLKYMNRNAYIVCALYGAGLCSSASHAMDLIFRNAFRALMLNNVVSWVLWLGKVLITVSMSALTWYLQLDTIYGQSGYWWVPVLLVVVGVYLVTDIFFSVYVVAVDAIFLCFLEDCERHDGSLTRPYYMSQRLRRLLLKDLS